MNISETLNKPLTTTSVVNPNQTTLRECVKDSIQRYFSQLEGHDPVNIYDMVLAEVEVPLLETMLRYTRGNQSKAALLLGISRGTLRKKLKTYGLE